ncbi:MULTISPECIES: alpha/beta fold hydrolase [Brevibacterium]|uniref:alpha/beta fold hydrolase n=1 Tax=Brevibacterium TaxID=1696 RepID=UPI0025C0ADD2|nr:alpha/beta fold hydrolase [Brevibacterium sp.]
MSILRRTRWLKVVAAVLVLGLAAVGIVSTYRWFAGPPGVGHFRTVEGREAYERSYAEAMSTLPEPVAQHDVPTSYGTVRVYEWAPAQEEGAQDESAQAPPVVLIPGRASGVPMWQSNLEGFAASHRVLAFDSLGDAGMSVQAAPIRDFAEQGDWIDQVLSTLAPEGAHLVGHSFGGATAAAYAVDHPERVRSLTLLEPVLTLAHPPAEMLWWATVVSLPGLPQGLRERALTRVGGGEYDGADPLAAMIDAGTKHFSAALPTPSPLTAEQADRLDMPVSIALADSGSLAGGADVEDRARELVPEAEVRTWTGTSHSLPMEVAGELDGVLAEFWQESEG